MSDIRIQKLCTFQELLVPGRVTHVGIHGIQGSFTDEAWHRFTHEILPVPDDVHAVHELVHSHNVLRAVNDGDVDRGIFAFANSGSGGYLASIEAMGEYSYRLLALFAMPLSMCILTRPNVTRIEDVSAFFGHPVALSQCSRTFSERWPGIPVEPATDEMDTALSARCLAEGKIDPSKAVFASKRAASLYGLHVLAEGVHHDPHNATFFAVVSRL